MDDLAEPAARFTLRNQAETDSALADGELKARTLQEKSRSVAMRSAFKVLKKRSPAKLAFKKMSGSAKIQVSPRGKVTAKRGLQPGTYQVKVKASQHASRNYKAKTITHVTFRVKVA